METNLLTFVDLVRASLIKTLQKEWVAIPDEQTQCVQLKCANVGAERYDKLVTAFLLMLDKFEGHSYTAIDEVVSELFAKDELTSTSHTFMNEMFLTPVMDILCKSVVGSPAMFAWCTLLSCTSFINHICKRFVQADGTISSKHMNMLLATMKSFSSTIEEDKWQHLYEILLTVAECSSMLV